MSFNTSKIEIAITYRCNLHCENCGTLCTQAPCNNKDLGCGHIVKLLYDCKTHNHRFDEIHITGGEPVLHRDFDRFYTFLKKIFEDYKYDRKQIHFLTNYSHEYIRKWIDRIEVDGFSIGKSEKSDDKKYQYVTVNNAPCDVCDLYTIYGCNISAECGIAYNYDGYFPCTPMAAASRVFSDIKPVKSISALTLGKMYDMAHDHCKRCGHSRFEEERSNKQVTSETWESAFNEYRIHNCNWES